MVALKSIENSRQMRYQSLNAYRKRFSMKPYASFEDLTGERTTISITAIT
jgi:prostaglandin-endoperoxide synthase 2